MAKIKRVFWWLVLLTLVAGCNRRLEIRWVEQETPTVPPPVPPLVTATPVPETATPVPPTPTPLPPTATPEPPTPTPVPPTATPVPPTATPLPLLPTATAVPVRPNLSGPARIRFAPGGTSAVVGGWLPRGGVADYVLRAQAGQTMEAWIQSPGNDVFPDWN